jgi:hypothetical protein
MTCEHGDVAQLAEHLLCKERVRSSSLLVSTIIRSSAQEREATFKSNIGTVVASLMASGCHPDRPLIRVLHQLEPTDQRTRWTARSDPGTNRLWRCTLTTG